MALILQRGGLAGGAGDAMSDRLTRGLSELAFR